MRLFASKRIQCLFWSLKVYRLFCEINSPNHRPVRNFFVEILNWNDGFYVFEMIFENKNGKILKSIFSQKTQKKSRYMLAESVFCREIHFFKIKSYNDGKWNEENTRFRALMSKNFRNRSSDKIQKTVTKNEIPSNFHDLFRKFSFSLKSPIFCYARNGPPTPYINMISSSNLLQSNCTCLPFVERN